MSPLTTEEDKLSIQGLEPAFSAVPETDEDYARRKRIEALGGDPIFSVEPDQTSVQNQAPGLKPADRPGMLGNVAEVAAGLTRGGILAAGQGVNILRAVNPSSAQSPDQPVSLSEQALLKAKNWLDALPSKSTFLAPSKQALEQQEPSNAFEALFGHPRTWFAEGTQSFTQSMLARVPGAAAAISVLGSIPHPAAKAAAVAAGSATSGGGIFGVDEYMNFLDEATKRWPELKAKGYSWDDIRQQALKSGAAEFAGEAASDFLEGLLFGGGLGAGMTVRELLKRPGKELLKTVGKTYLKTAAAEVPAEMFQGAAESYFRREIGLDALDPKVAASRSVGPTLVASLFFAGAGQYYDARMRNNIRRGLEDPSAPPEQRIQAVEAVAKHIENDKGLLDKMRDFLVGAEEMPVQGKEVADKWRELAMGQVVMGRPIPINDDLGRISEIHAATKEAPWKALEKKAADAKVAEGLSEPDKASLLSWTGERQKELEAKDPKTLTAQERYESELLKRYAGNVGVLAFVFKKGEEAKAPGDVAGTLEFTENGDARSVPVYRKDGRYFIEGEIEGKKAFVDVDDVVLKGGVPTEFVSTALSKTGVALENFKFVEAVTGKKGRGVPRGTKAAPEATPTPVPAEAGPVEGGPREEPAPTTAPSPVPPVGGEPADESDGSDGSGESEAPLQISDASRAFASAFMQQHGITTAEQALAVLSDKGVHGDTGMAGLASILAPAVLGKRGEDLHTADLPGKAFLPDDTMAKLEKTHSATDFGSGRMKAPLEIGGSQYVALSGTVAKGTSEIDAYRVVPVEEYEGEAHHVGKSQRYDIGSIMKAKGKQYVLAERVSFLSEGERASRQFAPEKVAEYIAAVHDSARKWEAQGIQPKPVAEMTPAELLDVSRKYGPHPNERGGHWMDRFSWMRAVDQKEAELGREGFLQGLGWPSDPGAEYRNVHTGDTAKLGEIVQITDPSKPDQLWSLLEHYEPNVGRNEALIGRLSDTMTAWNEFAEKHPTIKKAWVDWNNNPVLKKNEAYVGRGKFDVKGQIADLTAQIDELMKAAPTEGGEELAEGTGGAIEAGGPQEGAPGGEGGGLRLRDDAEGGVEAPAGEEEVIPPGTAPVLEVEPEGEAGKGGRPTLKVVDGKIPTLSGRMIPAPPPIRLETDRKAVIDVRKVDAWLLDQGREEAAARNDDYVAGLFAGMNPKALSPADKDILNQYLFGHESPKLVTEEPTTVEPESPEEEAPTAPEQSPAEKELEETSIEDLYDLIDERAEKMYGKPKEGAAEGAPRPTGEKAGAKAAPTTPKAAAPAVSAEEAVEKAVKLAGEGVSEAIKGLYELFGGASLKVFPGNIDKETYRKAKPHFEAAWENFKASGQKLEQFVDFILKTFGERVREYLKAFVHELKGGAPILTEGEAEVEKPAEGGPTEAQKEAGNYKKGHISIQGLDVSIENPIGSVRSGIGKDGTPWQAEMKSDYGYVRRTEGADGDQIDTFVGPSRDSQDVFVVNQIDPETGIFDEHKVMLGYGSQAEAEQAYLENYEQGWQGMGSVVPMTMDEFKAWLAEGDLSKEAAVIAPGPQKKPAPEGLIAGLKRASAWVEAQLRSGAAIAKRDLNAKVAEEVGGSMAEGAVSSKDAFDALELGVSRYILSRHDWDPAAMSAERAEATVGEIAAQVLDLVPSQMGQRTEEQLEFQQFSTPPDYAFVVSYAAGVRRGDVVLEPSAGLGGLAVFAKLAGAELMLNELAPRRADLLQSLNIGPVTRHNAEQIDRILPRSQRPTVVVMNPPFSATAGRIQGQRVTANSIAHIQQALDRLAVGGRLVAIMGKGFTPQAAGLRDWFKGAFNKYNFRALVPVEGKGYAKYGTTFGTVIIIIDKDGSATDVAAMANRPVANVAELVPLLEGVRDERLNRTQVGGAGEGGQPGPAEPGGDETPAEGEAEVKPGATRVPPGTVGTPGGPGGKVAGPPPRVGGPRAPRPSGPTGGTQVPPGPGRTEPGGAGVGGGPAVGGTEGTGSAPGPDLGAPGERPPGSGVAEGPPEAAETEDQKILEAETPDEAIFDDYRPPRLGIPGAQPHAGALVQSSSMAAVSPPQPTYKPEISEQIITEGRLSAAQLEAIVYAGMSHQKTNFDGTRKAFFIGDGTGVGKGREVAGIILDNMARGRNRAIWVSANIRLNEDAIRDWSDLGGHGDYTIGRNGEKRPFSNDFVPGAKSLNPNATMPDKDGIAFTTYGTLRSNLARVGPHIGVKDPTKASRLDQLIRWTGGRLVDEGDGRKTWMNPEFDGVLIFDEAHAMQGATPGRGTRGQKAQTLTGLAGLDLQRRLPNARIVYVSATGATEVENLGYAVRLGLWGPGTAFGNREDFMARMNAGGVANMELVARDLKALGLYIARNLSYRGVAQERIEHVLSQGQREQYNIVAGAWQIVLRNVQQALASTQMPAGAALSAFWGANQRFFNQIVTSMQMPSIIKDAEEQLAAGKSVVMQLVNTNEAAQDRALAAMDEEDTLEDLDLSPKQQLLQYLEKSFPVFQFEDKLDPQTGQTIWVQVVDGEGNPVLNPDAVEARDNLIADINAMDAFVDAPLDMLINHFGPAAVAEVTGRSSRIVWGKDKFGATAKVHETRTKGNVDQEIDDFKDGKRRILVFSNAGGVGVSFHSDKRFKNQQQRIHYLVQAGWEATRAVQGFGRTHRTNYANLPVYKLVTTDIKGQKRFIASIARRLDQLGALTKGERRAAGQGLFSAADNLESQYAVAAMHSTLLDLYQDTIPDLDFTIITEKMGLHLVDRNGQLDLDRFPKMTQFLNRLLALEIDEQNALFGHFETNMNEAVAKAIHDGTYDVGVENYKGSNVKIIEETTVYTHKETGAQTKHVVFEGQLPNYKAPFDWVLHNFFPRGQANQEEMEFGFYRNKTSGKLWALKRGAAATNARTGLQTRNIILHGPSLAQRRYEAEGVFNWYNWEEVPTEQARDEWERMVADVPDTTVDRINVITGALLPIWDRLPDFKTQVIRIKTADGNKFLGRMIQDDKVQEVLAALGIEQQGRTYSPEQIRGVLDSGGTVRLANRWTVTRVRVQNENRYEIGGDTYSQHDFLLGIGAFRERIQYNWHWYIPVGDKFAGVWEKIVERSPVLEVNTKGRGVAFLQEGRVNAPRVSRPGQSASLLSDRQKVNRLKLRLLREATPQIRGVVKALRPSRRGLDTVEREKADAIARALGKDLVFVEGEAPFAGTVINNRTIFISDDATRPELVVLGHELGHQIEMDSPALVDRFSRVLFDALRQQPEVFGAYMAEWNRKRATWGMEPLTEESLWAEYRNDMLGAAMNSPDFWQRVRQTSPTIYQRIVRWLKEVAEKLGLRRASLDAPASYLSPQQAQQIFQEAVAMIQEYRGNQRGESEESEVLEPWDLAGNDWGAPKYEIAAWHGSPHDFDQFGLHKIGTGEGAQAYGWGLYFAGAREVAESYRNAFEGRTPMTARVIDADGRVVVRLELKDKASGNYKDFYLVRKYKPVKGSPYPADGYTWTENEEDAHDFALDEESVLGGFESASDTKWLVMDGTIDLPEGYRAYLYSVTLAPDEDEYLDWDKPLSEQSEKVKAALAGTGIDLAPMKPPIPSTGEDIFGQLFGTPGTRNPYQDAIEADTAEFFYERLVKERGGPEAASRYLASIGIPGIRYLDQQSRGKGEGTSNYVIFDDKLVEIKEKYRLSEEAQPDADLTVDRLQRAFPTAAAITVNKPEYGGGWDVTLRNGMRINVAQVDGITVIRNAAREAGYSEIELARGTAKGMWLRLGRGGVIQLTDAGALDHEVFHAAMELVLTDDERAAVLKKYGTEERAAEAYREWMARGRKPVNGFFQRIYEFFRRLRQELFPTAEGTFEEIASGRVWDRPGNRPNMRFGPRYSIKESEWQFMSPLLDPAEVMTANPFRPPAGPPSKHTVRSGGLLSKFMSDVDVKDMSRIEEFYALPWFFQKDHPEFRPVMDIEMARDEERQALTEELTKSPTGIRAGQLHEFLSLKFEEADELLKAIIWSDAHQKVLSQAQLRDGYAGLPKYNEEQITAYYAWKRSMEKAWETKLAYAEEMVFLPYRNRPWVNDLKAVVAGTMKTSQVEFSDAIQKKIFLRALKAVRPAVKTLKQYRDEMGRMSFYFPRVRDIGDFKVSVWDEGAGEHGEDVLEHLEIAANRVEAKRIEVRLAKEFGGKKITTTYAPPTSEDIFGSVNDAAMDKFMTEAINSMVAGGEIDAKMAEKLRDQLFEAIANQLKQRGFGRHFIQRKGGVPVTGYKTTGGQRLFHDYMSSMAGYLTKQKAAFFFYEVLHDPSFKSVPKVFDYARTYVKDMLRNYDQLDRASARARAMAFNWYLLANVKAAAVNLTQNFVTGIPELARFTKGAQRKYFRAMVDVARGNLKPNEKKALQEAIEKGMTTDQYLRDITGRAEGRWSHGYLKAMRVLNTPFSAVEIFNRKAAFLAMYRVQSGEKGLNHGQAFQRARDFLYDVHFLYGKANLPQAARAGTYGGRAIRTLYTFRTFNHNYLLWLKNSLKGEDGRLALGTMMRSMAYLVLLGGITSFPWLDDLLEQAEKMFGVPYRAQLRARLEKMGGDALAQLGFAGLPALVGVDLSGSLAMGLPGLNEEAVWGVYGGLYTKAMRAWEALSRGDVTRALEYGSPAALQNILRAQREASQGLRTPQGYPVFDRKGQPMKLTATEKVARTLGFRPVRESMSSQQDRVRGNIERHYQDRRTDIYAKYRMASPEERKALVPEIQAYNREALKMKGAVPFITNQTLKRILGMKPKKGAMRFEEALQ